MDTNELWTKMQGEFGKIHSRLDVMEEQTKEIPKMKEEMATMKGDIATLKEDMAEVKGEVTTIKGEMTIMNAKIDNLAEKLDTTINVNLAQILNSQTLMRAELKEFMSHNV